MTLETANPIIVALILLHFVLICMCLVVGALNHYWKEHKVIREREGGIFVPNVLPQTAFESLYGYESEEGDEE